MKKRMLSILLALCMVLALLPMAANAAILNSYTLGVQVEPPVEGQRPGTTATSYNNVGVPKPITTVTGVTWSGELDANGCFKAGVAYTVTVTESLNENYREYFDFKAEDAMINRNRAHSVSLSEDAKAITGSYTFEKLKGSAEIDDERAKEEAEAAAKYAAALAARRAVFYTSAQADASWWKNNQTTLVLDGSEGKGNDCFSELTADQVSNITRLLLDYPDPSPKYLTAVWTDHYESCFKNIQEVWLSPRVDAKKFLDDIKEADSAGYEGEYKSHSGGILNGSCTIFVPDSQLPKGLLSYSSNPTSPAYGMKVYSGDVYEAFTQGASAGQDWCPGHDYTGKVYTASRMMQNMTCQQPNKWYYSCKWCGKCEYDTNHTFSLDNKCAARHNWFSFDMSAKNYIGTNERGEKAYCRCCTWCGISYRDYELNCTYEQYKASMGSGGTMEGYKNYIETLKKNWAEGGTYYKAALKAKAGETTSTAFVVAAGKDVTAKMSPWAENEVGWAAQNNLIDQSLLGNDYTAAVNRLQFCSVVVRMAEKLTFKAITPAPADSFTDTDNQYILKAVTAGITNGMGDGTFNPDGILNRQQMATFIYRALMYVKNNSAARYTTYESKLGNYSDSGQLADWAREPMAFMNALGLIKGTSDTQLSPNANCTIEQAILAAYRSLSAEDIGWYQSLGGTERNGNGSAGGSSVKRTYYMVPNSFDDSGVFNQLTYRQSERFWVTGRVYGKSTGTLSIVDPYTGDIMYIRESNFRPVKAD